ncbi:Uncharacterised protein [Legionella steigerwaltii]|uniref:Uncharacterized protein n=1 Tax=Legionella steigerwaltii TaxID=460 RepID=A0A378LFH4_9GAMM|nr:hypothetical protein [Legionella steigerwaltii]KTD79595.1 hypothetical protein Lstg_0811 [Legionella steigerwaltii]STY24519.1 Uncharacterised protein [Legionella steigerwaltii]
MSKNLTHEFRASLISYLQKPHDLKNKKKLTKSAFALFDEAAKTCNSIEPGKYMTVIDEMVEVAVRGIKIHPYLGIALDSFSRELSQSDLKKEALAFHVLNLTYNLYLKNNLIDPEKVARKKLKIIEQTIQQLKTDNNPYATELESALVKLTILADEYFKLSPIKQFQEQVEFERKLKLVCADHQAAIESDAQVKSAFYGFLAVIFSLFNVFGLSLADEYYRKNRFFQEISLAPKNTLSNFKIPFIEIEETQEESKIVSPSS